MRGEGSSNNLVLGTTVMEAGMQTSLETLSSELAAIVERFQPYVVAVHARSHFPSSGVHLRPGYVVTADHTIRRDDDIQISAEPGKQLEGILVGRDPGTDLAVLKVEGLGASVPAAQKSAPLKAGDLALVIGRSPNSGVNVSFGCVSAVSGPWRTFRGGQLDSYVRLDARMFPNSSGGAVVDAAGRLRGIATAGLSRMAGLTISAATVEHVLDTLIEKGRIPRGYIGVAVQAVAIPQALRSRLSLRNETGVMLVEIEPQGPAEKAGLLPGDMVVAIDDSAIENGEQMQSLSDAAMVGKPARLKVIRGGELREIAVTVGERPRG
jgi:S1-C subfamily serine protease